MAPCMKATSPRWWVSALAGFVSILLPTDLNWLLLLGALCRKGGSMARIKTINVMPAMREWWDLHKPRPVTREPKSENPKPVRAPASELDLRAIKAISRVTYPVGVPAKRFARDIQGATELTDGQRDFLWMIVYRYRRQIEDVKLVEHAEKKTKESR